MEARSFLAFGRDGMVRKMFVDVLCPARALFIAPIQAEVHGKTDRPTDVMTGDGIVCERIRILAMIVMAIDIVEQTPYILKGARNPRRLSDFMKKQCVAGLT